MKCAVRLPHLSPPGLSCLWFTVLATIGSVSCYQQEVSSAAGDRLNVLVITLDTIRADRLGAYGNSHIRTDFVEGLADRGILFERCVAPTPPGAISASVWRSWGGQQRRRLPTLGRAPDFQKKTLTKRN